jgi:hypothetical protein
MKRRLIQYNLLKNSISAYFAMIEIHNKPNIMYRYETATLLMINSWELVLKSFIRKYIKNRNIFTKDGHTIELNLALAYVEEYINSKEKYKFTAIKENIESIEEYRNSITHFYNEELEPYIFMLLAKSALNYVEFVKEYFYKDIMADEGLFILPLGFKLPFKPEEFLSNKAAIRLETEEAKEFMSKIVKKINNLKDIGIEDSIVLGFNLYLESVKKCRNSDIIAAISTQGDEEIKIYQSKNVRITDNKNAPEYRINDSGIVEQYPLSYKDVWKKCKLEIKDFKKGKQFDAIMKALKEDKKYSYGRKTNLKSEKSSKTYLYAEIIIDEIKNRYN